MKGRSIAEWALRLGDLDWGTWTEALQALATAGETARGTVAVPALLKFVDGSDVPRAALATWALGKIADPACVDGVIARLERSRSDIQVTGKIYLRREGYADVPHNLDFQHLVEYGFWTLSRCGGPVAIEFLRGFATTEPFSAGVNAANDALSALHARVTRRPEPGCFGLISGMIVVAGYVLSVVL